MALRWPGFRAQFPTNLAKLEAVLKACQGTQLHPVLLDLPRDMPAIGHAFDAPIDLYHLRCARLARKYGVPWINFIAEAHFVNGDFFDIFHTVEPGRVKYQGLLSDATDHAPRQVRDDADSYADSYAKPDDPDARSELLDHALTAGRRAAAAPHERLRLGRPGPRLERRLRWRSPAARASRSTSGGIPRRATTRGRRPPA